MTSEEVSRSRGIRDDPARVAHSQPFQLGSPVGKGLETRPALWRYWPSTGSELSALPKILNHSDVARNHCGDRGDEGDDPEDQLDVVDQLVEALLLHGLPPFRR